MPVSQKHDLYDKALAQWTKVRLACLGEDAIKQAGSSILPRLSGQDDGEYSSYLARAMFYGAAARTVQGLTGAIFRKPPDVKFPELAVLKKIGRRGESFEDIAKQTVNAAVSIGRQGILVDAPVTENGRPFIALYEAEAVINWLEAEGPNGYMPVEVVLYEEKEVRDPEDPYATKVIKRYRVLRMGNPNVEGVTQQEIDDGPIYFQDIYEEREIEQDGEKVLEIAYLGRVVPRKRGGKIWHRMPFRVVNSETMGLKPEKSPMLDLVNVNLSHYRNSADLEHGRHFTALPTAWVAGFDPKTQLVIGASRAWVTDQTNARAGFLEFTGAGLGHLQEGMHAKEKLMAVLGARMLEELPVGTEAAEAVRLRQSGEASALASISLVCSTALTEALEDVAEWLSLPTKDISVVLNRDFQTAGLAPNVLQNLILAVQGGLLSWETFFYNLQRGELIPDSRSVAEEFALIREGASTFIIPPKQPSQPSTQTDKRIK